MERVWRDLGEAPAHQRSRVVPALLHDVRPAHPADLARVELRGGVVPEDVPGIETGVVHAQRGTVPASRDRQRLRLRVRVALGAARDHPHVLQGAALQYPACVDLAAAGVRGAVLLVRHHGSLPASDQKAIERELSGAVGRGVVGVQHVDETVGLDCGDHRAAVRGQRCGERDAAEGAAGNGVEHDGLRGGWCQ
jgi:hypothetical protein